MAQSFDSGGPRTTGTAHEIPSKYLPPVPYAELPEAKPLKYVLGPSVLLLAGAIGSGEYVIWPYIASQVGLVLVWLAVIGVLTQYFLNMEIERYTLATGETAVTGFTRLWKHWSWLFVIMTIVPWAWPGWATGGTQTLAFAFGCSDAAVPYATVGVLVLIGAVLTASPVVYRTVEKIQFFLVGLIVLFLIYTALVLLGADGWLQLGKGFAAVDQIPSGVAAVDPATLLGAIAFAGAGGALNLVQSNWIRDKGLGMGSRMPRVASPFTGHEQTQATTGYFFPQDEENLRRWRAWWRVADREQFVTFAVVGTFAILLLMTLTFVTIGTGSEAEEFDFIQLVGDGLGGGALTTIFWLTGTIVLFSTNLAVLDMVGRVTADVLKTGALRESSRWSESRIYFLVVWLEILFGSAILLSGLEDEPLILLVIASSLNGIVMFVYSALLIRLNRGTLPRAIGLKGGRLLALGWAVLFYGGFSLFTVYDQFGQLFG